MIHLSNRKLSAKWLTHPAKARAGAPNGGCGPQDQSKRRLRRKSRTPTARHPYHLFSTGAAAPSARWARPRRSQIGRVGAPSPTQTSGAQRRLPGGRRSFRVRCVVSQRRPQPMCFATPAWQAAAKVGPRRPPARSLRLGERGGPTIVFRRVLLHRGATAPHVTSR